MKSNIAVTPSDHSGDSFAHDELCLKVTERIGDIAAAFCSMRIEMLRAAQRGLLSFELEAPVGRGFVDVMILLDGEPLFCIEVKTDKDKQHPGGWLRQVKFYSAETSVPAVIVVAHDLTPLQVRYLHAAKMPVLDLRTMQKVVPALEANEGCFWDDSDY